MVQRMILVLALGLAQPAAAIQMVDVAQPAAAGQAVDCRAEASQCAAAAAAADADPVGTGSIIAGLAGLLVLGLVFGRRRGGLPEVVS